MNNTKFHFTFRLLLVSSLFLAFCVPLHAGELQGTFSSPFGLMEVENSAGGSVTGRLKARDQCGRKAGSVILTGSQLDDSITGSLKTCFQGSQACKNDEVNAPVLLLLSPDHNKLTGVVHLPPPPQSCEAVLKKEGVTFKRQQKRIAKQKTQPKPKPKINGKKKAAQAKKSGLKKKVGKPRLTEVAKKRLEPEKRLKTALNLIGRGKAEEARAIFLELIELKQKMVVAYNGLGVTFYLRERYAEAEKASKNAYKAFDYTFPSGRVERIQGYEDFTLDILLNEEGIDENDINAAT